MAYTNEDSINDGCYFKRETPRHNGPHKADHSDFEAQVASQQAIYNAQVEESLERERRGLAPVWSKPVSLPATKNPPVAYAEQRSFSVDQGTEHVRKIDIVQANLNAEQQDAYAKLTGKLEKSHQWLQASIEEERQRRHLPRERFDAADEEELRLDAMGGYDELRKVAASPIRTAPPTGRSLNGLPSNPRPDPYRRQPSSARTGRSISRHDNPPDQESLQTNELSFRGREPLNSSLSRGHSPAIRSFQQDDRYHDHQASGTTRYASPDPSSQKLSNYQVQNHERKASAGGYFEIPAPRPRQASHDREPPVFLRKDSSNSRGQDDSSNSRSRQASRDQHGLSYGRKESTSSTGFQEYPSRNTSLPQNTFDAPRSAVNAGSRKVRVMCDQISLTLVFMPNTTVTDLLLMARERLGEGFDMARYILVEFVKELGLERPLRHYERVRDVLNSWDTDEQNYLLIQPYHAQWEHESLDLHHAPKMLPTGMTATLYYSHRPESWHKWIFTLRADGQIVMQKYTNGDNKKVCHMSDFDIYVPTSKQMKKLSPPRKFCFAIKSLQKSAAFQDTSNFVHFFSASDKDVAAEWYRAVHGWRSYYMVHQMGLGEQPPPRSGKPSISAASAQRNASIMHRKASEDKPLPPLIGTPVKSTFQTPANEHGAIHGKSEASGSNRSGSVERNGSAAQGPGPFAQDSLLGRTYATRKESAAAAEAELFAARGLLGNGYAALKESANSASASTVAGPFAEGGLLGRGYSQRKESTVATEKPLAHPYTYGRPSVDHGGAGGTSTTLAPSTEWKFDPITGKPLVGQASAASSDPERGRSRTTKPQKPLFNNNDNNDITAFTGGGLLALAPTGQGGSSTGRGARKAQNNHNNNDGRPAGGPLIDLHEKSQYVPGSLLGKVEMQIGGNGIREPVIQRERVHEVMTKTGEAFF